MLCSFLLLIFPSSELALECRHHSLQREPWVAGLSIWETQSLVYSAVGYIVYRQAYVYASRDSFLVLFAVFAVTVIPLATRGRRHMRVPRPFSRPGN